ncbi:thermonuclease family protein [Pleurocapsales cyanobacterium LEGE 06147]|nr:thermonuclease family protein [Pleurocapsales cyanobacterium LEGE 06147]
MGWIGKVLILGCCLLLFSCQFSHLPSGSTVQVQKIVSGQTIEVVLGERAILPQQVRLVGISAPDLRQHPWGEAAKQRLEQLIRESNTQHSLSQTVLLESEIEEPDRFGRLLAHVWHNGTLVSEQLVKEGYVLAELQYPHKYSQRLQYAQEYARLMGYGIWNPGQPMRLTPAEFRSQHPVK